MSFGWASSELRVSLGWYSKWATVKLQLSFRRVLDEFPMSFEWLLNEFQLNSRWISDQFRQFDNRTSTSPWLVICDHHLWSLITRRPNGFKRFVWLKCRSSSTILKSSSMTSTWTTVCLNVHLNVHLNNRSPEWSFTWWFRCYWCLWCFTVTNQLDRFIRFCSRLSFKRLERPSPSDSLVETLS